MIKNRTFQLIFLTMACTVGLIGTVASLGLFQYKFRWDFYIHFTNISNYFCLGVLIAELVQVIRRKGDGYVTACPLLKFMGMLGILLTFLVFNIMLAPARSAALNFTVNSLVLHIVMPILFIADWFLFYPRRQVKWTYPIYSVIFPLLYAVFIYIHAAALGFDATILVSGGKTPLIYPYFFLNLDTQGVLGVAKWLGLLFVGFMAMGYLFYGLDKLGKRPALRK